MIASPAWAARLRARSLGGLRRRPYTLTEVYSKTAGVCYLCGEQCGPEHGRDWQIEHVLPRSRGGPDDISNVMPAHADCNQRKGAKVTHLPAGELQRAAVWTAVACNRLAALGIRTLPIWPAPDAFGPRIVTLRLAPGNGQVGPALAARQEIRVALAEAGAMSASIYLDPPSIAIEVPRMAPRPVHLADMDARGLAVQIGVDSRDAAAYVDLASEPHAVIIGTTGGGKSVLLQVLAYGLARLGARLALADGDAATFDPLRGCAALAWDVADTQDAAVALVLAVQAEIDKRPPDGSAPPLVLMIDEVQRLVANTRGRAALQDIMDRGRKRNMHAILASQSPRKDRIDTELLDRCGHRIALRLERETTARLIGCEGATRLLGRGDALVAGNPARRVQVALPTADDFARLPRAANHAPATITMPPDPLADLEAWGRAKLAETGRLSIEDVRHESQRRGRGGIGLGRDRARPIWQAAVSG